MATTARPRTMYNHRTGQSKQFPSGGAAKRAAELDPNWRENPPADVLPPSPQGSVWDRSGPITRALLILVILAIVVVPAFLVATAMFSK